MVVVVLGLSIFLGAAGDARSEMKVIFSLMADQTELCLTRMKGATTAGEFLGALNRFADQMEILGPKALTIYNRNPNVFKDSSNDPEMKSLQDRVVKLFGDLAPVMRERLEVLRSSFTPEDTQELIKIGERFGKITNYFTQMSGSGSSTSSQASASPSSSSSYASSGDPRADMIRYFTEICDAGDLCILEMKNSRTGGELISALTKFADRMEDLGPRCLDLYNRNPAIYKESVQSAEAKALLQRVTTVFSNLAPVMKERLEVLKETFSQADAQALMDVGRRFEKVATYFTQIGESAK